MLVEPQIPQNNIVGSKGLFGWCLSLHTTSIALRSKKTHIQLISRKWNVERFLNVQSVECVVRVGWVSKFKRNGDEMKLGFSLDEKKEGNIPFSAT